MSMTEQGIQANAKCEGRSVTAAPVHPVEEFNQRFAFEFSTRVEEHDADRRLMMVDYAREFGCPELSDRLAVLFGMTSYAAGDLPLAVLDVLDSKFGK
jgi:hypothetical protein